MSKIDAVLLDAGGVLLMPDSSVIIRDLSAAGVKIDELRLTRAHYAGMRAVDRDRSEPFSWWPYNHAYIDELEIPDEQVEAARVVLDAAFGSMEWNVVVDESVEALDAIAARGVHMGIVSNSDGSVERLLSDRGVGRVGSEWVCVVDSHILGVAKPDPAIFHHALETVGVPAERAVHVGDSIRFDVEGARAADVRPLHMDPFGMCSEEDHEHIRRLVDVTELL